MICVETVNGIYVTPKHDHSPVVPIHVMKSTNPPKIDCEVENCRKFMQIAWSSGNPGKECVHLERTKNAKQYMTPAVLKSASLQDMLSKGLMSSDWGVQNVNKWMWQPKTVKWIVSSLFLLEIKDTLSDVFFSLCSQMNQTAGVDLEGQE